MILSATTDQWRETVKFLKFSTMPLYNIVFNHIHWLLTNVNFVFVNFYSVVCACKTVKHAHIVVVHQNSFLPIQLYKLKLNTYKIHRRAQIPTVSRRRVRVIWLKYFVYPKIKRMSMCCTDIK